MGGHAGRISELHGQSGAGKSTLCYLAAANAQKEYPNELVVYLDLEQCLAKGSLVWVANRNKYEPIETLVGTEFQVISANKNNELIVQNATAVSKGIQKVYTMSTTAGRKITATCNHEFLTQNGYKRLQDISIGDTVYTPRNFGECLNSPALSEKESALWGLVMDKTTYLGDLQELKVVSIVEEQEKQETYDISVANLNYIERNYLAEGLIVHNCVDLDYLAKLGTDVSPDKFLLIQPDSGVQALTAMEEFCEAGVCSLIILDSIAALRTEQEINGDVGDQHMAVLARLLSAPMKNLTSSAKKTNTAILFVNQVRAGIGIYGAPDVTPGGNAIKFYPSLRVSVSRKDWIKKGDEPIGQVIRARTIKNRMNSPYKVEEISLIFGEGIDQVIEAVDVAVEKGIIVRGGAWFNLVSSTGEELKFQGRDSVYDYYRNSTEDFEFLKSKLFTLNTKVIETPEEESFEDLDE